MPAAVLSLADKLKLLVEWSPAIQLVTAISVAQPGRDRALSVMRLLEFAAKKTDVSMDDDLVRLIQNVLLTPEGGALLDYLSALISGLYQQAHYEQFGPDRV